MTATIGIIAEDKSDVEVIEALILKSVNVPISTKSFVGNGCGKIRSKCRAWAKNLQDRGCKFLILVQDLDKATLAELEKSLLFALTPSAIQPFVIVIPVREIEAWLLSDHEAIRSALKISAPIKRVSDPERIPDAKKHLGNIIYHASKKKLTYLNTIHNVKIARACQIGNYRRCESFQPLQDYVVKHIAKAKKK